MIQQCECCGTSYNPQTVSRCPACKPNKHRRGDGYRSEVQSFMRSEIGSKKQMVNSFRRAEVSRYEREKGKNIYQKL